MKDLLDKLEDDKNRSIGVLDKMIRELSKIIERQIFFRRIIKAIRETNTNVRNFFTSNCEDCVFFTKDAEPVLITELNPPSNIYPNLERCSIYETDQEKMSDGTQGYIIFFCTDTLVIAKSFILSFEKRKLEERPMVSA